MKPATLPPAVSALVAEVAFLNRRIETEGVILQRGQQNPRLSERESLVWRVAQVLGCSYQAAREVCGLVNAPPRRQMVSGSTRSY